ncbi:unnamed protein product [Cochlearia groenlandica]
MISSRMMGLSHCMVLVMVLKCYCGYILHLLIFSNTTIHFSCGLQVTISSIRLQRSPPPYVYNPPPSPPYYSPSPKVTYKSPPPYVYKTSYY